MDEETVTEVSVLYGILSQEGRKIYTVLYQPFSERDNRISKAKEEAARKIHVRRTSQSALVERQCAMSDHSCAYAHWLCLMHCPIQDCTDGGRPCTTSSRILGRC